MDDLKRLFQGNAPEARYRELRSTILHLDPAQLQVSEGEWTGASVALMEMVVGDATATLVAVADGTVSLYTSAGGATIGGDEHLAARQAGQRFLQAAADAASSMSPTTDFPLPDPGQVRFQVRTPEGSVTAEADEDALRGRRDPLFQLYVAGQDLMTEIRLIAERGGS